MQISSSSSLRQYIINVKRHRHRARRRERHYWRDCGAIASCSRSSPGATVAVRYKQTVIGVAWAVIRPFLTMVVFTVVFGRIAKLPSDGDAPYRADGVRRHAAMDLLFDLLSDASNSLIGNANLISKVYFPRLIVPTATWWWPWWISLISFCMLVGMMVWYRFLPDWRILSCPSSSCWRFSPASARRSG